MWRAFLGAFTDHIRQTGDSEGTAAPPPGDDDQTGVIKEPPMEIVGEVMTADEFVDYVENLDFPSPLPKRIFLHHTWRPTRDSWRGMDTILAMKDYYERQLWEDEEGRLHEGWTAGPHLFIADDGIWLFSDVRWDGVGVYGHNHRTRHIEMVGNYDRQLPSGATLANTIVALGILHERLGLDIDDLAFHRDFSTKSCPGWAVRKDWIIPQAAAWIRDYRRRNEENLPTLRQSLLKMVRELLVPTHPHASLAEAAAARGLLGALTYEIPLEIDDQGYIVQIFAEALLVPTHEGDKVVSLQEYEQSRRRRDKPKDGPEAAQRRKPSHYRGGPCMPPSPQDPFPFDGDVR